MCILASHAVSVQIDFLGMRARSLHHLVIRTDLEETVSANGESFDHRVSTPQGDHPAVVIDSVRDLRYRRRAPKQDKANRVNQPLHKRRLSETPQHVSLTVGGLLLLAFAPRHILVKHAPR